MSRGQEAMHRPYGKLGTTVMATVALSLASALTGDAWQAFAWLGTSVWVVWFGRRHIIIDRALVRRAADVLRERTADE